MKKLILLAATVAAVATPLLAQPDRTERVAFARGAASKAIRGTIRGYAGVSYIVGARAGQTMTASFESRNGSAYFNVWAPGTSEAIFIGSAGGSRFAGTLPASGDYRIQVYLMRNAARRDESADYMLTIGIR